MQTHEFEAGGRARRLFRADSKDNWWIRFIVRGKSIRRSCGTPDTKVAMKKAKSFIELEINGDQEAARNLKVRNEYPTLQAIVEIFEANYATDAQKRRTARTYINALARIVLTVLGKTLENVRVNALTDELVLAYVAAKEKLIECDRYGFLPASEATVRASICGELGNARAVFGRKVMGWYKNLELPDLSGFMRQAVKHPERGEVEAIDDTAMDAINTAAPELALTNPRCYIAHLMFKLLGMRNFEIRAARMSWIVFNREHQLHQLRIKYRPEEKFKPKKGTERDLTIDPSLLAEIQKYWTPSPDGDYIVPANNPTHRYDIIDREHNAWVGQWIKGLTKVSYELRRYAGSLVYFATKDPVATQRFLGHKDFETTQRWYQHLFKKPTYALTMAQFTPGASNVVPIHKSA